MIGTFTLTLKEPEPIKKVYKYQRTSTSDKTVSFTLTSSKMLNIYWGDGSHTFDCSGTSQTYTAILSRSDVLSASSMPGYKSSDVKRLVGGAMEDGYKSLVGLPDLGAGQSGGGQSGGGQSGGGYSGGGQSGGGQSGGGQSGGRMKKHLM